jgi:hypothetical protein
MSTFRQKLTALRLLFKAGLLPLVARMALRRLGVQHVLETSKDGGPESTVWAHWLFECKGFGSIVLLRFEDGSREAYQSHAFNSLSWLLSGGLVEDRIDEDADWTGHRVTTYLPSAYPIITTRDNCHMVQSVGRSWVLSFRGPWASTWQEHSTAGDITLASGRVPQ